MQSVLADTAPGNSNRHERDLLTSSWRLVRTGPLDAATNMALDVGLMEQAKCTRATTLRVYSWKSPTLSLGRNQPAKGCYDPDRLAAAGVDVVRRPTGGRAVLHWREVTYSVTAAANDVAPTQRSYDQINQILLRALGNLGVSATVFARPAAIRAPSTHPCFAEPSAGEIVTEARGVSPAKLIASAQVRESGALLQHGSILVEDDQNLVADLSLADTARPRAATLRSLLGRTPDFTEIADALFDAILGVADKSARQLPGSEVLPLALPHVGRFRDPLWTWRL